MPGRVGSQNESTVGQHGDDGVAARDAEGGERADHSSLHPADAAREREQAAECAEEGAGDDNGDGDSGAESAKAEAEHSDVETPVGDSLQQAKAPLAHQVAGGPHTAAKDVRCLGEARGHRSDEPGSIRETGQLLRPVAGHQRQAEYCDHHAGGHRSRDQRDRNRAPTREYARPQTRRAARIYPRRERQIRHPIFNGIAAYGSSRYTSETR